MTLAATRLILFAIPFAVAVAAGVPAAELDPIPPLGCHKSGSAAEQAVCGHAALAKLDRELARLWDPLVRAYDDEQQRAEIHLDRLQWLAVRDACGADVACIEETYRDRIRRLDGTDSDYPAAGLFEAKSIGTFALYPLSGEYLVSIRTAAPKSRAWTCAVTGRARAEGGILRVAVGDFGFPALLPDSRTLIIDAGGAVSAAEESACGPNGTFEFTYTRSVPTIGR
jgi:uncharacterized protein